MIKNTLYTTENVGSWRDLVEWYSSATENGDEWLFRGISDSNWGFQTSLERAYNGYGLNPKEYPLSIIEKGLMKRFIRQSHRYLDYLPDENNTLEWLSIMQHYGAPTRLQDWTHSLFVAVFFAVEQAYGECAIWAIKHEWIIETAKSLLKKSTKKFIEEDRSIRRAETFKAIFDSKLPQSLVFPVKPHNLNERLIIQQGTFLCPGDISKTFEENLSSVLFHSSTPDKLVKLKIEDNAALRQDILKNLNRMNMNAATLYPGLVGFAQSLRTLMIQPEILRP